MAETAEAVAAEATEDTKTPETTTDTEAVSEVSAQEVEDKALKLGWRPKTEFKGDPEKWIDAATFVRRGEEILPFLQLNNKQLERALEKANRELTGLKATVAEFKEHHSKTEQRAIERARRDLEAQLEAATTAGDVQAVKDTAQELADLTKEVKPEAKTPAEPEELTSWKVDNPWFAKDAAMRGAAIEIVNDLIADGVTSLTKQLEIVDKRIREAFPQKFENPRRREAQAVETSTPARPRAAKAYSDLPADAKAACDRFVRAGLMTRERYVQDYQWI